MLRHASISAEGAVSMDEPALNLDGVVLSPQKEVVRVFYKEMWDHADKGLIEVDPFVRTTGTDFLIGNAAVPIS
jgi:hypothetical protein